MMVVKCFVSNYFFEGNKLLKWTESKETYEI